MDGRTIADSVARTRRLVVVEEGPPLGGYAAEVVAAAAELVGLIVARRVTMPDIPIAFSPPLETSVLPSAVQVAAAARELIDGKADGAMGGP